MNKKLPAKELCCHFDKSIRVTVSDAIIMAAFVNNSGMQKVLQRLDFYYICVILLYNNSSQNFLNENLNINKGNFHVQTQSSSPVDVHAKSVR